MSSLKSLHAITLFQRVGKVSVGQMNRRSPWTRGPKLERLTGGGSPTMQRWSRGTMPKKREHGTGTVTYEERRRKWIGRVQVGVVDGRRRWREVSASTRKEASELL